MVIARVISAIFSLIISQQVNAEVKCQIFDDKVSDRLIQYIRDSDLSAAKLLVDELESICNYGKRNTEQDVLIDIGWLFIFNHDFIYPPKEPIDVDGLADRIRLLPREDANKSPM